MAKRLLLVEDDDDLLHFARVTLEMEGHEVFTARSGAEALAIAHTTPLDLVLLDLMLPALSGWEVLTRMRHDPHLVGVPIAILTASANPPEEARARQLGASDYLVKPLSADELVRRVEQLLGVGGQA